MNTKTHQEQDSRGIWMNEKVREEGTVRFKIEDSDAKLYSIIIHNISYTQKVRI